jgi:hypothetical protein
VPSSHQDPGRGLAHNQDVGEEMTDQSRAAETSSDFDDEPLPNQSADPRAVAADGSSVGSHHGVRNSAGVPGDRPQTTRAVPAGTAEGFDSDSEEGNPFVPSESGSDFDGPPDSWRRPGSGAVGSGRDARTVHDKDDLDDLLGDIEGDFDD